MRTRISKHRKSRGVALTWGRRQALWVGLAGMAALNSACGAGGRSTTEEGPRESVALEAVDDTVAVSEDTPGVIDVLSNDTAEGAAQLTIVSAPDNGSATVDNAGTPGDVSDDVIRYQPAAEFSGTDSLRYRIAGGDTLAEGLVTITVNPVTPIALEVTFPPPGANLGGVDSMTVSGRVRDTDDGSVDPGDVGFISANAVFALQQMGDLSAWNATGIDVSGQQSVPVEVTAESGTGETARVERSVQNIAGGGAGQGPGLPSPAAIVVDEANGRGFLCDSILGGVVSVDLATGDRTQVSGPNRGSGPEIGVPTGLALDTANNRVLVLNEIGFVAGAREVLSIDLTTGDRSVFSGGGTGSGPAFSLLRDIAVDAANGRALVADAGQSAILAVDLGTGDRSVLSDAATGSGPALATPDPVAVDATNGQLLVGDVGLDAVLSVDLATGDRRVIADASTGSGPAIPTLTALALDADSDRVLLVSPHLIALMAVDMTTGGRSLLSDAASGNGPVLSNPFGLAVNASANHALVVDTDLEAVITINLAPGAPADRVISSK